MTSSDSRPRARILTATLGLLATGGREAVSTRAVSAAAGVQAQTIYRQFGDMSGLLAAAAHEGFRSYLASKSSRERRADPVDDLRDGWDLHIDFGLQNPALYLLMYGEPGSNRELAAAADTARILRSLVEAVARAGRLQSDVDSAAAMIHSTGIGVVMTLIGTPPTPPTLMSSLSTQVREAVLKAIVTPDEPGGPLSSRANAARHASALRTLTAESRAGLTPGESLLLDEILVRISTRAAERTS